MSTTIALDARQLSELYPAQSLRHSELVVLPQIQHRIELIKFWEINLGEKILEIGCGQGDTTLALSAAVGERGHVTALDPASLDYGSPYTLGEAQNHLKASPLGPRMTFVQADPLEYLAANTDTFTAAVISHCIWYFSSPSYLNKLFSTLAGRVGRVCVAEWALMASDPNGVPHVLAALTQASMECRKPESTSNIRTVLSPAAIALSAEASGLQTMKEEVFTPADGMLDGSWEVGAVMDDNWLQEVHDNIRDEREKGVVIAMRDTVKRNRDLVVGKGEKIKSMDVWVSMYTKAS